MRDSLAIHDDREPAAVSTHDVHRIAEALAAGHLVAFPTDTVFALACAWNNSAALERIYVAKSREPQKAIPVLVADLDAVTRFASSVSPAAAAAMRAFWPGALTIVLPARTGLDPAICSTDASGNPTVALRMPDHPFALAVIRDAGGAVAATSANISGEPPLMTAAAVREQLGDHVAVAVDHPGHFTGRSSTVVRLDSEGATILREGDVSANELQTVIASVAGNRIRPDQV